MNSRGISISLLALNLVLLAAIGFMAYLLQAGLSKPEILVRTKEVTNTITQITVRKINATNLLAALANRPMNWAAIESTNYSVYITNLRGIGCPEQTIRDLLLTDVAKLYARRRAAVRNQGQPFSFWKTGDAWESGATPQIQAQLRELDQEQRALIRELLGVDFQTEMARYWNDDDYQQRMYEFLPVEKREKLTGLHAKYDEMEQELYARTKGWMLDEDQEQLRKLQKQKEEELAQVLTPEELEEYELRNSGTANNIRAQLNGFDPTEEEFRKIFRFQQVFDRDFEQAFDSTDEAQMEVKTRAQQEAQEALSEELKSVLGESRFAEYHRAQDEDYKTLVQMADRFDMPREVAGQVYEMKQAAETQRRKIESDPNLTDEQRQRALSGIAQETQKSLEGTLGEKVYKAYQRSAGQWIRNLASPVELSGPASGFPPLPGPLNR